jgi:hypothetical protein
VRAIQKGQFHLAHYMRADAPLLVLASSQSLFCCLVSHV